MKLTDMLSEFKADNANKDHMFDIDFDAPNPTKEVIRAYTKRYNQWVKPAKKKAEKLIKSLIKLSSGGEACPKCKDSEREGHWFFRKEQKWCKCGRCAGKGYITATDDSRLNAYKERKDSGAKMDSTYLTFA